MKVKVSRGFLKFLALFLVFIIGFLSCAGTLVLGGWHIYKNVSYEKLQSWGLPLPSADQLLDSHADVRLTSLSMEQLLAEIQVLSTLGDRLSVELLVQRYGVKLPEPIESLLPPALMEVSLQTLFSPSGIQYVLDNTETEFLFAFLPEGILSEPAKDAIREYKLSTLMGGDFSALLQNVKIGYFLGVTYEKRGDGDYELVYADPASPTVMELIAPLSLGKVLDAVSGGGDVLAVVKADIGDCELSALLGGVEEPMASLFEGKTLGDLIVPDSETGMYKVDMEALTDNVLLGDLMGYEPIKDDPNDPDRITGWMSGDAELSALENVMADIALSEIMSDEFDITDTLGDLYLGEIMGYEKVEQVALAEDDAPTYVWYEKELDPEGNRVPLAGIDKAIAGICLGDVLNGGENVITDAFSDLYLGEIMDYEKGDASTDADGKVTYKCYEKTADGRVCITGINDAVANILLGDLLSNEEYEITDAFSSLYLGEVMGYEKGAASTDADGNVTYTWYEENSDGDKVAIDGINKSIANVCLGDLLSDDEYSVTDAFSDLYLGEIIGYEKGAASTDADGNVTYTWYEEDSDGIKIVIDGIDKAIANIPLDDLLNNEEYEITDAFSDLYLGEVMGYEKGELKAEATQDAPAQYVWTEDGERVSGIKEKFSNYILSDVINGTADISADDMYLYEVMDLHKKVYPAYAANGTLLSHYTVWYEDEACTTPAASIFGALAELTVADLESELPGIFIGSVIGMVQVQGTWYEVSDVMTRDADGGEEAYVELTPAEGIMISFADLSIDDMSHDDLVRGAVNDITLADALGLTQGENGKYYDVDITAAGVTYEDGVYKKDGTVIEPVSGIMTQLADKKVGSLTTEVDQIYIGEVMGWVLVDESDPKNPASWEDENGDPVKGVMSSFAGLTVKQMSSEGEVQNAVKTLTLADALGYELRSDGKYYENGTLVEGIMAQLADKKVGSLTAEIDQIYIGEVMGWVLVDESDPKNPASWEDENSDPVKGVMSSFAGLTVKQMSSEEEVQAAVKTLTLADALGYELGSDGKYYDNGTLVEGIMAQLAAEKVGNLTVRIDAMYLGEIMGWIPHWVDEADHSKGVYYWEDTDGHEADGFMSAFAHLTVKQMTDEEAVHDVVKTLTLVDAMNYTKGENGKYYEKDVTNTGLYTYNSDDKTYYDKTTNLPVKPIDGVLATLVDSKIGDMQHEIENTYVGEMLGWTPVWVDENDHSLGVAEWLDQSGKTAKGLARPFASLTLRQMSDESEIEATIETIYVYETMGYTLGADGKYYDQDVDDETQYRYTDGAYYNIATSERVAAVDGIMAALAGTQISGIDTRVKTLKVSDVFSEEERTTGFLSLIDENTPLYSDGSGKGLSEAVTETFTNAPIGQFLKDPETPMGHSAAPKSAQLIELNADTVNILNMLDEGLDGDMLNNSSYGAYEAANGEVYARYWQTLKIQDLLEYIVTSAHSGS